MFSFFFRFSQRVGLILTGLLVPFMVRAQGGFTDRVLEGATNAGQPAGLTKADNLESVIGNVIGAALSLVGVLLIVLMIYSGFLWMTAGGNTEQVKKARSLIINAVIGLVIVFAAYAIVRFVLNQLGGATANVGTN